jgi:putative NIF3 family GTP cyclohydrolase 1 type 2
MKLRRILDWLGRELEVSKFDDVSNNGLQIEGPEEVTKVAFAVDASLESVNAAVAAGAQLLIVHHGISWGGGIRRWAVTSMYWIWVAARCRSILSRR